MNNPCVKTGVVFNFGANPAFCYTGDLFGVNGVWWIKGINPSSFPNAIRPRDITIIGYEGMIEMGPGWGNIPPPFKIDSCADEFRKYIAEWYPELLPYLPPLEKAMPAAIP